MAILRTKFPALVAQKETIENRRISNVELAEVLEISDSSISRWRSGVVSSITHPMLMKMCKYFHCDVGDLLYIEWEGELEQA